MARHIIFIHGRGNKPWSTDVGQDFEDPAQIRASRDCLRRLWLRAFMTGLQRHASNSVYNYWRRHQSDIHMAYYGDVLNILNREGSDGTCRELRPYLLDLERRSLQGSYRAVRGFLKDRSAEVAAFISQGLGFKDNLLLKKLKDLKAYVEVHSSASAIRGRLHRILDPLLADRHRVAIIAHSLGSLVTYDALWKISHRSEFSSLHSRKVDNFATIGSPMGNEAFLNQFRLDADLDKASQFPRNITRWDNFTARGDYVAHDAKIRNDLRRRGFLPHLGHMEDHTKLHNPYINRKGKWNPHKSFAYLLQEELADVIEGFTVLPPRQ